MAVGEFATFVSRIREDHTVDNGLSLWVVSDNLRKGAALNAVQIADAQQWLVQAHEGGVSGSPPLAWSGRALCVTIGR